jgi:hypothetical protein
VAKKGKEQRTDIEYIKIHPPQSAAALSSVAPPGAGAVWVEGRGALVDAGDIVDGDVVEVRKLDNQREGDFPLALLIVGIGGFVHPEGLHKLLLRQVAVLPQIPQTWVVHPILQIACADNVFGRELH